MPSSARKSSLGLSVRRTQKAHIPYRGENNEVGKKTGMVVRQVERKSDGFEPFSEIMQQADARTPPKVTNKQGKKARQSLVAGMLLRRNSGFFEEDDDEYEEVSMEIDSPLYRNPVSPKVAAHRPSSFLRPISRTSNLDFDQVPSPRAASVVKTARKSIAATRTAPAHTNSSLSRSRMRSPSESEEEEQPPPLEEDNSNYYNGGDNNFDHAGNDYDAGDGEEDYPPNPETPKARKSYAATSAPSVYEDDNTGGGDGDGGEDYEMEEDDQMEVEEPAVAAISVKSTRTNKANKSRDSIQQPVSRSRVLEEVNTYDQYDQDNMPMDDQEEEEQEPTPKPKKTKIIKEKPAPKTTTLKRKENRPEAEYEGQRRSQRYHYKPLEWWRGEKVVYGKPQRRSGSGPILVPNITEIVRMPKEEVQPLGGKRKRGAGAGRGRSKSRPAENHIILDEQAIAEATEAAKAALNLNPEEGWDDDTESHGLVVDYITKEPGLKKLVCTQKQIKLSPVGNQSWMFTKIFDYDDFLAAGEMLIPVGQRKRSRDSQDNAFVFFILEGAVNARINDSNFTVCTGGMFHVPRGTVYHIENIASRDTRILFMQARRPASAGLVPSRQSSMALGEPSHRYMSNSREPSVPVRVKVEKIGGKGRKVRREETIEEEEEEEEQEQSEEEGRRKKAKKANGPKR